MTTIAVAAETTRDDDQATVNQTIVGFLSE